MKHIFQQTVRIAAEPGKLISHPLKRVFERHYQEKKFARTLFVVDIAVLATIAVASALIVYFTVLRPPTVLEQLHVDATVAPTDVVSGGLSTLVIRYENTSDQTLAFARLNLTFPAHFDLRDTQSDFIEVAPQTYELGTIEAHQTGSIRLHGVMFGDVGGEQTFKSDLTFTYGKHDRTATKSSEHTFRPSHSTLALELVLPDRVVRGQQVKGQIKYKNTGEVDFPEMIVEPIWPEGFVLLASTPTLTNGQFTLTALSAGKEGVINFVGQMPPVASVDFAFDPSFTFGADHYKQEILTQTVTLLPSQLSASMELVSAVLTPGATSEALVQYEQVGELTIKDAAIIIVSEPNVFSTEVIHPIGKLTPGEKGEVRIPLGIIARPTSNTTTIKTYVVYTLADGIDETVRVVADLDEVKITTPVVLEAFARYTSPEGDQLGRGPLPPTVDEETKYWIFLTVQSTTSAIEGVEIDANLGPGVAFTGKQSVSVGESLTYDAGTNAISWQVPSIDPTVRGGVVSVAFEVALTPTEAMIGTTPVLVSGPLMHGQDAVTGAQVVGRGATITTNLPYDQLAAGLGVVEE